MSDRQVPWHSLQNLLPYQRRRTKRAEMVVIPAGSFMMGSPKSGAFFRYDEVEGQYIYNLSTKGFEPGVYRINLF